MASPSLAVVTKADTLAAALVRAQSAIGSAKKSSTNPHFKSRYADLTEVFAAALPALHENGIAVVQMPSANGPEVTVTTVLLHESGERLESSLTLTATQNTPQAIGSCITYGRRYGLAAMVGVTSEDDDGAAASAPPQRRQAPAIPDGFDAWWEAFASTAANGLSALEKAWKAAPAGFRQHAQRAHRDSIDDLKAAAREVVQ